MSSVIDRPAGTTPSSEWGTDPAEGRLSPRYTPTTYFRPAPMSSPYSRPHPPIPSDREVPGAYPHDPRDALDHLSACADDYELGFQDLLPARQDVQNVVSTVSNVAMGAIGAVGATSAAIVAAASGENEEKPKGNASPAIDNTVLSANKATVGRPKVDPDSDRSDGAEKNGQTPLIVPADLPSAPFLAPMPQLDQPVSDDFAPVAAVYLKETTVASDSSTENHDLKRECETSEAAIFLSNNPALDADVFPEDVNASAPIEEDYGSIQSEKFPSDLSPGNVGNANDGFTNIDPLALNSSSESLDSESGAGIGLASATSAPHSNAFMSMKDVPTDETQKSKSSEHAINGDDTTEGAAETGTEGERNLPINKLHLAAGAAGVVGAAASLVAKAAKRKNVPSADFVPKRTERINSETAPVPPSTLSVIPQSPAIFNEEFADKPPVPAPVFRPETKDKKVWQDTSAPGLSDRELGGAAGVPVSGAAVAPIISSNNSAEGTVQPSTHTPARAIIAPPPARNLSTVSSPAALAGETPLRAGIEETSLGDVDDASVSGKKNDKVSKLDLLAGTVGAAGVAAGLVAKIAGRKPPKKVNDDDALSASLVEKAGLNSPVPSELPKSPGIFKDDFVPVAATGAGVAATAPTLAGDYLTVPPSPNAADSPLARLPEERSTEVDAALAGSDTGSQDIITPASRSALPIPVATYQSDNSTLPDPGARAEVTGSDPFELPKSRSVEGVGAGEPASTMIPHCAAQATQSHTASDSNRFLSNSAGGMGANGLYVPDSHPPFAQLSSLPAPSEVVYPSSTIEAPLGAKVHGEPIDAPSLSMRAYNTNNVPADETFANDRYSTVAGNPSYGSSGSIGRSDEDEGRGSHDSSVDSTKCKTKKKIHLVDMVKEKLRF